MVDLSLEKTNMFGNLDKLYSDRYNLVLKSKDIVLAKFTASAIMGIDYDYSVTYVDENYTHLLPFKYDTNLINQFLQRWILARPVTTNREHIKSLIESLGLDGLDPIKTLLVNNACSLNDCYWIDYENSELTFKDVNLYDNTFEEALGIITFFGNVSSLGGRLVTPELTTQGVLGKRWVRENGKPVLYKKGTSGFANTGREPVTECISSLIADALPVNNVKYDLLSYKGVLCTKCDSFTDIDTGFLSMEQFLLREGILDIRFITLTSLLTIVENRLPQCVDGIIDMFIFDYIIENKDRHVGNYGFLFNTNTGEILGTAPLFDNGLSLSYSCMLGDDCITKPSLYTEVNPFGVSNLIVAKNLIRKRHVDWALRIKHLLNDNLFKVQVINALSMFYDSVDDRHFHYTAIMNLLSDRSMNLINLYSKRDN